MMYCEQGIDTTSIGKMLSKEIEFFQNILGEISIRLKGNLNIRDSYEALSVQWAFV